MRASQECPGCTGTDRISCVRMYIFVCAYRVPVPSIESVRKPVCSRFHVLFYTSEYAHTHLICEIISANVCLLDSKLPATLTARIRPLPVPSRLASSMYRGPRLGRSSPADAMVLNENKGRRGWINYTADKDQESVL
jgi:hypothetical protein